MLNEIYFSNIPELLNLRSGMIRKVMARPQLLPPELVEAIHISLCLGHGELTKRKNNAILTYKRNQTAVQWLLLWKY